jgi:Ca2+:H+ antiporter
MPLSVLSLILPNFLGVTPDGALLPVQAFFFALFTFLLYGVFLTLQTVRHRHFFVDAQAAAAAGDTPGAIAASAASATDAAPRQVLWHAGLLVVTIAPVVLLAKPLATVLDHGLSVAGVPPAIGGMLIAVIVFTPEAVAALRAALANQLQRSINLSLGAATSTIGLTIPATLGIGLLTGKPVVLGLGAPEMVLLTVTVTLATLTFSGPRTTVLEGAVHLVMFLVYIVLLIG